MALTKISGSVIKDSVSLSGNVSVGGTLTYEDVTNVDAIGIITARSDISIADKIIHTGDTNTAIRFPAADTITAETSGSERFRIDSSGRVLIGTTTEGYSTGDKLTIAGNGHTGMTIRSGTSQGGNIFFADGTSGDDRIRGVVSYDHTNNFMRFYTNAAERLRITSDGKIGINQSSPTADLEVCPIDALADTATIFINAKNHDASVASEAILKLGYNQSHANDSIGYVKLIEAGGNSYDGHLTFGVPYNNSGTPATREALRITSSGRLIIGHTGTYAVAGHYPVLQLSGTTYNGATLGIINNANDATGAYIQLSKQRSGSPAGATIVQDDDLVGQITFTAADGTDLTSRTAEIKGHVDGAPGSNDTPGRLSFWTTPDGAQSSLERVRITSLGRVSIGDRTTNPDELVHVHTASGDARVHIEGASDAELKLTSHSGDSSIFMGDSASGSIGKINYDHAGDDFIFTAGGNTRGRIYNDAGVTGMEHHQFIPFLIGYDVQTSSDITMVKRFGGMSSIPINADGDKAFMSYATHWRHREYALVRFWYGASGNTSGATFDWDFTVWSATNNEGYSVGSNHTFTVTSGTMSNGKMYGYNIASSWPSHHGSELVQFEIDYDELQGGTSLQLVGLELVEYTTA